MDHSMPPTSLLYLRHPITFNTSQAARYFRRAMGRQNVLFKQPRDCLRMLTILTWLSWLIALPHLHGATCHPHSFWWADAYEPLCLRWIINVTLNGNTWRTSENKIRSLSKAEVSIWPSPSGTSTSTHSRRRRCMGLIWTNSCTRTDKLSCQYT